MNALPTLPEIEAAAAIVHGAMPPTPQFRWPLLEEALGTTAWVKHENHTPTGAFKVRGGLVYLHRYAGRQAHLPGLVSATRGNHGQSLAYAARRHGVAVTIVVPHGNSVEKNAAMRALGATLIEHGDDFQASREYALALAERVGLHMVPSYHPDLVAGVATGWLEFFRASPDLETVFVPIGQGSGFAGAVAARQALGHRARIIGVVSQQAPAYLLSWRARQTLSAPVGATIADGMACRVPEPASLALTFQHADDIVAVSDAEVAAAMRLYYAATHNVAEGAGAAALAAALQLKDDPRVRGRVVGLPLTGANVDAPVLAGVLQETPR
ncbi:threonine dehydratase [Massilia sp. METH4]|uniref:threonine dehydratase n=1 Tax=Massilia sp. METH4 TaxID=3123041 RepID=UPI0030D03E1F